MSTATSRCKPRIWGIVPRHLSGSYSGGTSPKDFRRLALARQRASESFARQNLLAFKDRYNHGWLVQRHGYRTPVAVRAELLARAA